MGDPVADALRAAAVVLTAEGMESIMPGKGVRQHWMQQAATPEAMRQTAAAIAAFLRALPADLFDGDGLQFDTRYNDGTVIWREPMTLSKLAAAVERAAKAKGER